MVGLSGPLSCRRRSCAPQLFRGGHLRADAVPLQLGLMTIAACAVRLLGRWPFLNDGDGFNFNQSARTCKLCDANGGAHRRLFKFQDFVASRAEDADVCLNVHKIHIQLDDVLETPADRRERFSDVLKGLCDLLASDPATFPSVSIPS